MEKKIGENLNISNEQNEQVAGLNVFKNARGILSHHISHFLLKAKHGQDYMYSLEKSKETIRKKQRNY